MDLQVRTVSAKMDWQARSFLAKVKLQVRSISVKMDLPARPAFAKIDSYNTKYRSDHIEYNFQDVA